MSFKAHITVCICTCGRPEMLRRLLRDLQSQQTDDLFTMSLVVTDNDSKESARSVVSEFTDLRPPTSDLRPPTSDLRPPISDLRPPTSVTYTVQPKRNIALARNTALAHATGDFIACIDDDEFPVKDWLLHLYRTCEKHQVAGVLGPVLPHFDDSAPRWVIKGKFYDRPRHATGHLMPWHECRTGNVLFRRSILPANEPPFREEFGTGGEDQDFFQRAIQRGHQFIWCDEAIAYETVPPSRWDRKIMLSRALLRGKNSLRHKHGRLKNLAKSLLAVPAYALALPFLFLAGHHLFMRYLVKLTDHLGRILAGLGLNPVSERQM